MKRIRLRVEPEETESWPGPGWEPVIFDGSFSQVAEPGDIYINRYRDPPLYYMFNQRDNCELVSREEIKEWVTGGLMKVPGPDQPRTLPSKMSKGPTSPLPVE